MHFRQNIRPKPLAFLKPPTLSSSSGFLCITKTPLTMIPSPPLIHSLFTTVYPPSGALVPLPHYRGTNAALPSFSPYEGFTREGRALKACK